MRTLLFTFIAVSVLTAHEIEKVYIASEIPVTISVYDEKVIPEYMFTIQKRTFDPFYIGKYELSIKDYKEFLTATSQTKDKSEEEEKDDVPLTLLDFSQAQEVCRHFGGRLPTEAEWVIAASVKLAPSKCYEHLKKNSVVSFATQNYPLTESMPNIACMIQEDDELEADLIGSELLDVEDAYENINGTYGMLGNVWEWVDAPKSYFNQTYQTIKGGSFANVKEPRLFDNRISNFVSPQTKATNIGFRCVWDQKKEKERE